MFDSGGNGDSDRIIQFILRNWCEEKRGLQVMQEEWTYTKEYKSMPRRIISTKQTDYVTAILYTYR